MKGENYNTMFFKTKEKKKTLKPKDFKVLVEVLPNYSNKPEIHNAEKVQITSRNVFVKTSKQTYCYPLNSIFEVNVMKIINDK